MSTKILRECRFLIPLCRDKEISDGDLHQTDTWQWLDSELAELFGGRTKSTETLQGSWKNPKTGAITSDESIQFIVAVPKQRLDELRDVLSLACIVFAQQCIYLSIAGNVEFVEPIT
jgi:hypothetical protein